MKRNATARCGPYSRGLVVEEHQKLSSSTVARRLAGSLLVGFVCAAHAQSVDMPLYEGRWAVTLPAGPASARQGTLRLAGFDGSWRYVSSPRAGKDPCKGRRMPVTVQVSRAERLEVSVWGSAVAADCPDLNLVLDPAPGAASEDGAAAPRPARPGTQARALAGTVNGTPGVLATWQAR